MESGSHIPLSRSPEPMAPLIFVDSFALSRTLGDLAGLAGLAGLVGVVEVFIHLKDYIY